MANHFAALTGKARYGWNQRGAGMDAPLNFPEFAAARKQTLFNLEFLARSIRTLTLATAATALAAVTVRAVDLPFDHACPVFYDNDDHRDVYTDEYLMALAHLGEIRLTGITTTYAPSARDYESFVEGRAQIVEAARRSGFKNLPDPQPGTGARLTRPASNRPKDTKPLNLAASRTLIETARKASPEKPLVFLAGGQLTVAADAWLLAPDIADRVVVAGMFGVPRRDYNASLDAWAWTIVVSKFRVFAVPFGTPQKRGNVFLKAAEVPKARIRTELPQDVPFFRWMLEKRHPSNPLPDEHDYDGHAAVALTRPDYIVEISRWRPDGILPNGDAKLVRDDRGPVIEALDADQSIATGEFWRAVKAAALPKPAPDAVPSAGSLPFLRVSENRRFLVTSQGRAFFWLADTAWELFHRLDREEADRYLANRAEKGFTVIQAVALAELDGLNTPNAYGHRPLCKAADGQWDPARPAVNAGPDDDYWDHVDWIIDRAAEKGLYVALLPTWGDKVEKKWGAGPVIFNEDNAREYGRWIGTRYRDRPNLLWMVGGDRPAHGPYVPVWNALAEAVDETAPHHLITFHFASSKWAHDKSWLDFNTIASGHERRDNPKIYEEISRDYLATPPKPVLDSEPLYESHPVNWHQDGVTGWFDDFDVRKAAYWSVFAGACGFTYGCHDVWQMHAPGRTPVSKSRYCWQEALDFPGAKQMGHLRRLLESRPFLTRIPDQPVIASDPGTGADHLQATRDADGSYAMVYSPSGKCLRVRMDKIAGPKVKGWWFNPSDGKATAIGEFPNTGEREFTPPSSVENQDWVLVLDDTTRGFSGPGQNKNKN